MERHGFRALTIALRAGQPGIPEHGLRIARPFSLWTCTNCRTKLMTESRPSRIAIHARRQLSITALRREIDRDSSKLRGQGFNNDATARERTSIPTSTPVTAQTLGNGSKSDVSERMSKLVDQLLSRASIAKQRIDTYTGTDYTNIEALRKQIDQQEKRIEESQSAVQEARANHQGEILKQTSAQKEIVSLLERKSSWLPADLERYMILVRSEHVNDQSVQAAKFALDTSERDLEDARAQLQKLVGQEYHEEHIWSETIRRNNTWLTFGLMGVNILLLLAQILIFEPHRRHKIVRDLKEALDEKTIPALPAALISDLEERAHTLGLHDENVIKEDNTMMPTSSVDVGTQTLNFVPPLTPGLPDSELEAGQLLPEEAVYLGQDASKANTEPARLWRRRDSWAAHNAAFWDLFSDRIVEMRQIDATTLAVRSLVAGAAVAGLMITFLRRFGFNT